MIQLSKGGNINLAKEANGVTEFSIGWVYGFYGKRNIND